MYTALHDSEMAAGAFWLCWLWGSGLRENKSLTRPESCAAVFRGRKGKRNESQRAHGQNQPKSTAVKIQKPPTPRPHFSLSTPVAFGLSKLGGREWCA